MILTDRLFETAMKLFMKYGIKSVSMDDIAKLLGVSKKTIYAKVENKKDLIHKVIMDFVENEEKQIEEMMKRSENALEQMHQVGRHVIKMFREMKPSLVYDLKKYHPKAWNFIETSHLDFVERCIKDNIALGQKEGFYRSDFHPDIIAKLYITQSKVLVDEEVFPSQSFQKAELFQEFFSYHLSGICTDKGKKYLNKKIELK